MSRPQDATSSVADVLERACRQTDQQGRERLKSMRVFVLDNSLRESTVGAVHEHTIHDKREIYAQASAAGFKEVILGAFGAMLRVDDDFVQELRAKGEDFSHRWSFSEVSDRAFTSEDGDIWSPGDEPPLGLQRIAKYGIKNVVLEIDLATNTRVNWATCSVYPMFDWLLEWTQQEMGPDRRILVNIRDFPVAMVANPKGTLELVEYLAKKPQAVRPIGIMFEDAMGGTFPHELRNWTNCVRTVMDRNGWESEWQAGGAASGLLLVHVHERWGWAYGSALQCLAGGADGIWCSLSEEGAAVGHACSAVTLCTLLSLGNRSVHEACNVRAIYKAARRMTEATTNEEVPHRQLVYGDRALEAVFDLPLVGGGKLPTDYDIDGDGIVGGDVEHFDLTEALGLSLPPRLSTLASGAMFAERLEAEFGPSPEFTPENGDKLKAEFQQQLRSGRETEAMSTFGLAHLWVATFERPAAGAMAAYVNSGPTSVLPPDLAGKLSKLKQEFMDLTPSGHGLFLSNKVLYQQYFEQYLSCHHCTMTHDLLRLLCTVDADDLPRDSITWAEWRYHLVWAATTFPEEIRNKHGGISTSRLMLVIFRKVLAPLYAQRADLGLGVMGLVARALKHRGPLKA